MTKLKLSGGILAVLAVGICAATSAIATTGGHFTSAASVTRVTGLENTGHEIHFKRVGEPATSAIGCENAFYSSTVIGETVTSLNITPKWEKCYTTGDGPEATKFEIDENECTLQFTIGKTGTHHTVDIVCPATKYIEVTHPACTVRIPPQTLTGITYNTITAGIPAKHAITLESTIKGAASYFETGICTFLGTSQEFEMTGSVTIEGFDTDGVRTDITATTTTP